MLPMLGGLWLFFLISVITQNWTFFFGALIGAGIAGFISLFF